MAMKPPVCQMTLDVIISIINKSPAVTRECQPYSVMHRMPVVMFSILFTYLTLSLCYFQYQ